MDRQRGFTMAAVIAALFILALATQSVMFFVSQQAQREREDKLLRIGKAYREAIGAYYESSPGNIKRWPQTLEDLVEDSRQVGIKRYIREVYADPVGRTDSWGIVVSRDGGIAGVYSRSEAKPIRSAPIEQGDIQLAGASRYSDWRFEYIPVNSGPKSER